MTEDELLQSIEGTIGPLGSRADVGEEFRQPPLDIVRYFVRPVRLSRIPILGKALSVVAVVRQPVDLGFTKEGMKTLLDRIGRAINGRYPPFSRLGGLSVGLTAIILAPEPIRPEDDAALGSMLTSAGRSRTRCLPLALFQINPGQEAVSFALSAGPEGLFPEPERLADALCERLQRFVPPLTF